MKKKANELMKQKRHMAERCMYLMFVGLGVILLSLSGCKGNKDNPDNTTDNTVEIVPEEGMDLYGLISDSDGNPVENVVVSDGFTCTATDADGIYQMKRNAEAKFVFYSTPAGYVVNTLTSSIKLAATYSVLASSKERYDFSLVKLTVDETNFTLIGIGDPQGRKTDEVARFQTETVADIKAFVAGESLSCYGLCMGDVIGNDKFEVMSSMRNLLGQCDIPMFTTIGNHDKEATSVTTEPRVPDTFESYFGPRYYSFNRGKVHFISLDDVIYSDSENSEGGFTNAILQWYLQDLSYVSKDKMVILFYHIPLREADYLNRDAVLSALSGYAEVHLMCGHTHANENYIQTTPISTFEHIHGTACGAFWNSTICKDGTPNGFEVYRIEGNTIKEWFYKPTKLSKDFQIRLYRGEDLFGGTYGTYSFATGENTFVANIWNADPEWTIEAYEDGVKVADMTKMSESLYESWAIGYHLGIMGKDDDYKKVCKHLYLHTMVNPDATLEIRATDRFGNVYTQSEITEDCTTAASYDYLK